jgi:putative endonuclease
VDNAIQNRIAERGLGDNLMPCSHGELAGDEDGATAMAGEDAAAAFLQSHGYRILARNYRSTAGEADLIAMDGRTLVIVEVKRRDGRGYGRALSAVEYRKRATLRAVGEDFAQIAAPGARIRFDVVAIDGNRLALHRNAF